MSLVVSSVPSRLFHFNVALNPQPDSSSTSEEKTRPDTHKRKHSIENTPALNIVHISTAPWPWSRQPTPSSQTPINSIFILLDPFYHPHFAFPFGLPAVPYCSRRTQCPKYDFCLNTFAESLKHGAPVLSRYHNSDHAGSAQNLTILSPIVLPWNPFQSFVLFGTVGGGTTRSDNSDVYPCWSTFGGLKPPTNKRPAAYYI